MSIRTLLLAMLMVLLTGCAGFRGGVESTAHIPDVRQSQDILGGKFFTLPGIDIQVQLDNRLQTRDVQVVLFIVPVMIDLKDRFIDNRRPLRVRAHLTVTAHENGFTFRPTLARLQFAGRSHSGVIGFYLAKDGNGRFFPKPVDKELTLSPGQRYSLSIDFESAPPSPKDNDIVLKLDEALESPSTKIPPVHFVPTEWSQGYT